MGFFSWKTKDTARSIANMYSERKVFTVFMIAPMVDGSQRIYTEFNYDGYGLFGDKDYYELLAEINLGISDRSTGIDLRFCPNDFEQELKGKPVMYPQLYEKIPQDMSEIDFTKECEHCECQGFFY